MLIASVPKCYKNGTPEEDHKIDQRVMTLNLEFFYLNMAMVTLF